LPKFTTSNFPYAGVVGDDSLNGVGSYGYYWSRTTFSGSSQFAYHLYFYSSLVNPANYNYRYVGYSIRCVATT